VFNWKLSRLNDKLIDDAHNAFGIAGDCHCTRLRRIRPHGALQCDHVITKWRVGVTPPAAAPFPPGDPGQNIILFTGFAGGDAPGAFAAEVLYRKASSDGSIAQLWPIYKVSSGNRSFTALIQGGSTAAGLGLLEGVIMDGWRTGARVRVRFQAMTNCDGAPAGTCFKGTIRILRDNPEDEH